MLCCVIKSLSVNYTRCSELCGSLKRNKTEFEVGGKHFLSYSNDRKKRLHSGTAGQGGGGGGYVLPNIFRIIKS